MRLPSITPQRRKCGWCMRHYTLNHALLLFHWVYNLNDIQIFPKKDYSVIVILTSGISLLSFFWEG